MIALAVALSMCVQTPPTGQVLLDDLSRKAFDFFWQESHPLTGFTKDRAANLTNNDSFTVSSVASTGFTFVALSVGAERGWVTKSSALSRARITASNLRSRAAKQNGWFYHFIDWQTGARVWNCEVSSIDTSILVAGLIVAKEYFRDTTLSRDVDAIINGIDWNWMLTNGGTQPTMLTFSHGWRPENGWISNRWDTYSEQLILLIQALGAWSNCPTGIWAAMNRPHINYQGIELLMGGPLFIHQMSNGFLNFNSKRCALGYDYWVATRRATLANRLYCINNPNNFTAYGPNFWGLTACDGPDGYGGFGAPGWGDDNGTVAPTCVAAAIDYLPDQAQAALNSMRATYPQGYGRYGFSNGINPHRNWFGPDVIGIDLGMMLCAIENKRDGFVHRMSEKSKIIQVGMRRAGFSAQRRTSQQTNILRVNPGS